MANNDINFYVIANTSSADAAFQKTYNTAQKIFSKPLKPNIDTNALNKSLQPLGKFSSNFKEFEKSLDAATARVVAFTATTGLIYGLGNAFKRLTSDAIQVEAAVTRIQGILKASDKDLASFTDSIFKLANNTGQGFYDAAKAAEEFARQGLSLEQTLKATESALILTRLSGSNLEDTINGLVATVSSFSNELLDYGRVVNTLASIDAKFSTSAAGLVEGIKRVGSVASDAGVSFEELSSSIAAIRQITGRSESVIGNGLKTIFTNLQTEKVQQELAKLGIQTQKSTGEFLPLINVIDQLAAAFQNLNDSQRADLGQKVAGKYQINTFKALIQSFGGKDTSLFDQALQTAKGAQDEAIRRNELLNKTTLSSLNQLNNSITALGASFGDKVGKPLVDTLTKAANQGLEVLTGVFKDNPIGDFITGGIVSALKGPGIILAGVALAKLTKRIVFELTDAVKSVGGLNSRTQQNLKLDEAINNALKNGNAERVKAINLASTLEEKQKQINALLRESYPSRSKSAQPYSQLSTLVDKDTRKQVLRTVGKNAANGIMPAVAKEQNSIYNGVGGARKTAKPVIANINMAGGSTPVVVNTDEHIIRNFANTGKDAVFNRNMTRQAGGAKSLARFGNVQKVMAGGYKPTGGIVKPSILEAPFIPTTGETFGLDPRKLDFIRQIAENVSGARTKPIKFRKNLQNYGEFWPDSNNVLVNPKIISDKSPYYGGYSVPAHEYGHFIEYNSDPALMDLFKSAHKFDIKKKGSLFNQMYKKIGSGTGYNKKHYFSESFADTFAYSFLDRGDREPALGGRVMSDLMRELIMKNIPVKSKANGFIPNFARSRFPDKDDEFLGLMDNLDLDNIGYTPGTGKELSDRTIKRGINKNSFTRFTADRRNRIIRIDDTESYQKGDAFKNYSAIADFAKRKDFIVKSAAFVKQGSRDNTKDKGISLLYRLFPQLRYRDGVTKNTSGKYHIGASEKKFSSFHDLKSQVGQLSDSHIRSISKFSDIQDNFAGGLIPNFASFKIPSNLAKKNLKAERKQKVFDYTTSSDEFPYPVYTDVYGEYNKEGIKKIRKYNRSGISDLEEFVNKSNDRSSLAKSLAFIRKVKDFNINNPTDSDLKFLNSYYDDNANFDFTTKIRNELYNSRNKAINLDTFNSKPNKSTEFYKKILADVPNEIASMDFEETMGTPKFSKQSQKLRDLNQISLQIKATADYFNINRDRAGQHLKLKTVKNKDKLSEFALKKVIRNERRISDRDQKKDPMGLRYGREEFKYLKNNSLNSNIVDSNYLGIDKIKFLSDSIENPYFLKNITSNLEFDLDNINSNIKSFNLKNSSEKKNTIGGNVLNFLYKGNKKYRNFIQNIDGKIYDKQIWGGSGFPSSSTELWNEMVGDKTARYIEKKIKRQKSKITPGKSLNERFKDYKNIPFLERNSDKHIGKLIYESIKRKRKGKMAPQDPVGAQLALGNETIKEKLGFDPESLYGFAGDIDKAKYYFRGSSLDSFAIQNQLGEFTSSGFSNSDRVLGTNVSSSLLKAVGYAMSTGSREERPGLVGIYDAKKREYSDSLPSPYSNEKDNTLKFGKLAEQNLIAYFDPVSGRVLPKNNSLITGRKVDSYKVDYTKKLLEEGNILTKQYENSEQFKSDDSINLYRKLNISTPNTTLKGVHAPRKIFDNTQQALPRSVDDFIGRLSKHTGTPQPGFISFGQESSSFFDLRSFRPMSRDERKRMGKSKALEQGSDYGKNLIYKKQVKSSDLVDMATLEALKAKTPEEIQEFFSKDRIYDLDSILGKSRGFQDEREFTAFTTKPKFNIGRLIAKSAANGIIPNFAIDKSVYRHYYKQLKRQLRSSRAINDLSGYGFWDSMGKYNKSTTLYRGTDRGEVESILNKGSFASNWTDNYSGDRGTFVSSSINHAKGYSEQANKNKGEGYMLAFRKNIAGENRERRISHRMGGTSTNMAISGDIFDSDIRTILKYDESKKGKLKALSLGELLSQSMGREMSSLLSMGYPSYIAKNSIKVGSHDRLKSDKNPRGLGVYNTAQGQMSLGQALGQHAGQSLSNGIIPNFADLKTSTEKTSSKNLGLLIISTKRLANSFSYLGDYLNTSFLSSIKKTTGSIIDITDTTNKKFKGIIDPTNIPSNKNAALVDPTGQPYGKSETARRLGLPVPTPVNKGGISSNMVGLPASFNKGKSVNYKYFKDTPISSALLSLDVTSERKRESEAKRKSDKAVNEYIRNGINKSSPYGGKISSTQQKIRFTPNDVSETAKRLGLPMPTPIVQGGMSSSIALLPPSLRDNTRQVKNVQIPPAQTTIERLGLPAPTPVKNNPPVIPKPQPNIPKPLSYQELANAQLPAIARGLNLDVDAERKREADLLKKNNDAIEEDSKARKEAQKERDEAYQKSEKAEANREKNRNQYEKDKASREKQFAKDKRVRGRQGQIASIIEGRVSNLQFGGPEQNLKSLIERAEKSLGKEGASKIEKRFKGREAKAFEAFSAQSGFFTSDKKLKSIAKKLNISTSSQEFIDKREKVRSNKQTAIQTGAFALPFVVGGIANTLGGQDTSTGRVTSGIGEALGTGLLLSQFGPWGVAAGAAVGSFQVLSTVVKELTPDLNELSKKSREVTAANEKEISSLQAFVETSSQLKSLIDSNSSPTTIAQAKIALSESTRGLSGDSGMRLLKAKTDEERASVIQDVTLANQRKQSLADSSLLAGSIINEKASGIPANIDRILGGRRKFLDSSNSQTIASELVKTIDLSKISDEAVSKAKSGKASLKDLGLDNAEVGKVFDNINTFFNNGSKNQTGASEQILKFVQSLIVAQKSLDQLSSQQIDTAKIFASTKDSFLNILTSTFAKNQSVNRNIISSNEIGFSNAEAILAKSSESLSPEELLKGSTRIKQARIGQQTAIEKTSLGNEYTNKILEDIMSQASGTSLEDQIKIQDVLNKSITGESPFDPLKLTDEIQKILDPDASKSLQSQLLKTNIEMASKLQDIDNKSKEANEELKNQTEIQQKQLADTKLLNILGGFNSNFRDVLRSIKQPKGGLTTVARGEKANNFQFGEISNIGSAKPGSMDAVDKSQRNIEIATNRASYFSDIELPKTTRDKLNERNYKDLYLAGKSNVENRALAFGQSEILPQFDILKNKIAGKDTGSIGRKAIDKQLQSVKKSFDLGQIPVITEEFVKTMQSLMPQAGKDGAMQRALDVILDETGIVQEVFLSAEKSAKVLADKTIKGDKLPPEFDAQINAIGSNTTVLLQNTLSLDALQTVLNDLPSKINDLRTKSEDQVKAFNISNQIQSLQAEAAFKTTNLQKATEAQYVLRSSITQADRARNTDIADEKFGTAGLTSIFPSLSGINDPTSLYGGSMSGKQIEKFIKFDGLDKLPSSVSELNEALKKFIVKEYPNLNQKEQEIAFKTFSKNASYQELLSGVSRDSGLFEGGVERNRDVLNADILNNTKKIEELKKELEKLNSNTNVQSNNTTPVTPTTTQVAPTVNISFNGVGSVDPTKVKEAVYSALANINRENNLPPPIQRPVSNTLVA